MIFSIRPQGNIGNRMLAYMVAQAVAQRVPGSADFNASVPEWGLIFDQALHRALLADEAHICRFYDWNSTTLDEMAERIVAMAPRAVVFDGYFQQFVWLREVDFYRALFPLQPLDIPPFAEDELVINIRAGEILQSAPFWYPLVPPMFYAMLLARTGLRAVLLGQLDDSLYLQEILRLCPGARLLPSAGPMVDFNRLRHAKRLCLAVSTFSWLAGWLSGAVEIHYPLLGFLHPYCMPKNTINGGGVDLTPVGDARYLYHLFPILNAAPQLQYLRHTASLNPIAIPVAEAVAAMLSARAKDMTGTVTGPLQSRYVTKYPDAAWSIALGQYASADEHYAQLGKRHGYEMATMEKIQWRKRRPNLALGKPALQSSVSEWSRRPSLAEDAAGAVNGEIGEHYGFHTEIEDEPWWRVDLGMAWRIGEIWLFNRIDNPVVAQRAARLAVDTGSTETSYAEVFRHDSTETFGGADGKPLIIRLAPEVEGRFVRIRLLQREFLHLAQVEVYGTALS